MSFQSLFISTLDDYTQPLSSPIAKDIQMPSLEQFEKFDLPQLKNIFLVELQKMSESGEIGLPSFNFFMKTLGEDRWCFLVINYVTSRHIEEQHLFVPLCYNAKESLTTTQMENLIPKVITDFKLPFYGNSFVGVEGNLVDGLFRVDTQLRCFGKAFFRPLLTPQCSSKLFGFYKEMVTFTKKINTLFDNKNTIEKVLGKIPIVIDPKTGFLKKFTMGKWILNFSILEFIVSHQEELQKRLKTSHSDIFINVTNVYKVMLPVLICLKELKEVDHLSDVLYQIFTMCKQIRMQEYIDDPLIDDVKTMLLKLVTVYERNVLAVQNSYFNKVLFFTPRFKNIQIYGEEENAKLMKYLEKENVSKMELDLYMSLKVPTKKPAEFWRAHVLDLPKLCGLAKNYYSVKARCRIKKDCMKTVSEMCERKVPYDVIKNIVVVRNNVNVIRNVLVQRKTDNDFRKVCEFCDSENETPVAVALPNIKEEFLDTESSKQQYADPELQSPYMKPSQTFPQFDYNNPYAYSYYPQPDTNPQSSNQQSEPLAYPQQTTQHIQTPY
ncbi:hypothetical protein EIN_222560 [Entamoeba invadens IP1]|uniref:Uncharacterized protein n=1 Tax=Entamoeba invadens IP1 TaxID=370355 RepID=A0A0A1U810_ENTIV|nr:hypothetical protein EIN_222560 [Entamoeba invadens IP1]ELP88103.1 hypothetical protein EIN_222560 [Entamoeba invadens IP1]|eukprot:XP_004254874.1 hypothetical protein EIN_222560 [Entamoeba invadens IP1]